MKKFMRKFDLSYLKIAGLCGMIGPMIFYALTFLAIYYAPWFSWTKYALSHLGGDVGERPIWAARGIASILFNSGLIITGILGIVFAIGLRKIQKTPAGRLGATLYILAMFALCFVGVFPGSLGLLHGIAAYSLFLLAPFALWILGAGYLDSYEKVSGVFSLLIGIVAISAIFVVPALWGMEDYEGSAIVVMIFVTALSVYSITMGAKLFKQSYIREKHIKSGT